MIAGRACACGSLGDRNKRFDCVLCLEWRPGGVRWARRTRCFAHVTCSPAGHLERTRWLRPTGAGKTQESACLPAARLRARESRAGNVDFTHSPRGPIPRLPSRAPAPPRPWRISTAAPAACQPTSLPSRLSSTAWRRSSASLSKPYGASSGTPRTLSACSELLRRRSRAHWSPPCRRRCAERLDLRRDASHHRAGRCCKPRPHTRGGNVEARGVGLGGGRHVADGCAPIAHDHPARRQARAMLAHARGVMDLGKP